MLVEVTEMSDFVVKYDSNNKAYIETKLTGKALLTIPQLNKGTAFSKDERVKLKLLGKLPHRIETLDEQVNRTYLQFKSYSTKLQQNIYLTNLHDKNQILFYKLVSEHLSEILPVIYTPIVGSAVQAYSQNFRQARGLYIAYEDRYQISEILDNRTNPEINLIVVTDGEGVLGIGDQGIGGIDIPVAKLMVYSLCGAIDPLRTLPIFLDAGTNNKQLLEDPYYLGVRHPRVTGDQYDEFLELFITAIKQKFPNIFLHWEDFGRNNAKKLLDKYQHKLCSFNDDIQGTGAVTLAAMLAACKVTEVPLSEHRIVVFGAGSAGTGISDQILDAMLRNGLPLADAYDRFWLIDRNGLLLDTDEDLTASQKPYAKSRSGILWQSKKTNPNLLDVITNIKPTILIGCSAQFGAFTEDVIREMAKNCLRPIIFPLSNPDDKCEAIPENLLNWTEGRALVATGTAFPPVSYQDKTIHIAQCNNALVFPGIGLGLIAVNAKELTGDMLWAAVEALAIQSPCLQDDAMPLLPGIEIVRKIAYNIAIAVAKTAVATGYTDIKYSEIEIETAIKKTQWQPCYLEIINTDIRFG